MAKRPLTGFLKISNMIRNFLLKSCFLLVSMLCFVAYGADELAVESEVFYDKDWVKTSSNEWLTGEIISFYDEKLEFDSNEFDSQNIDAGDIAEIRSPYVFSVRLNAGRIYTGRIELKDKVLYIHQGIKTEKVLFSNVLTMVPHGDTRISLWSGSINLGANFRKGNIRQNDGNLRLQLQRRTPLNRLKLDYIVNKSEQGTANSDVESTVDNQRLNLNFDWFFSNKLFIRASEFEYYSDPFSNIESRYTYGVGLGYNVIDQSDLEWNVTAGPSYRKTEFSVVTQSAKKEDSGALTLGSVLDWEISKRLDFTLDYQLQFLKEEVGGRQHTLKTGLDIELTDDFELDFLLYIEGNDNPQPLYPGVEPKKNDYQFIVSLGYEF